MRSASTGDPLVDKVLHYEEGSDWTAPGYYYVGPGTHTLANILNGREPVNQLDSAALAHDIDYALVENEQDFKIADAEFKKRAGEGFFSSAAALALDAHSYLRTHSNAIRGENIVVYDQVVNKLQAKGYKKTPLQEKYLQQNYVRSVLAKLPN